MRIGSGYDVHRLAKGEPLIIGGVDIPWEYGLAGHSDADVLLHAVADALLGAAALGDLGTHFPDTDPTYEGMSSMELLRLVAKRVADAGYQVGNVDATVLLEQPKLSPYVLEMRANIAEAIGVDRDHVSVKATTGEGMGFVGAQEGAATHAVCLLEADD